MRIAYYSDLHLEFDPGWNIPSDLDADILILAGDIIVFKDFAPLAYLLKDWQKPVLFVAGNHEYYTRIPMQENNEQFQKWLQKELPQVHFLQDEDVSIDGVHFFGGTMWTDFQGSDSTAMFYAAVRMNDFRLICNPKGSIFAPKDSLLLHQNFLRKLEGWFAEKKSGPHVVVTHHAPVRNHNSLYNDSPLQPAFVAFDAEGVIREYEPTLWICGHTHECDTQQIGNTRIVSNQLGYPMKQGGFECEGFDERKVEEVFGSLFLQ